MKKIFKVIGIIALAAVIGFSMTACGEDDDSGGGGGGSTTTTTDGSGTTAHVHDWGDWTTTATCTEAGVETRTCKLDATHIDTRPVAALGHDYANWTQTTAPTEFADGEETETCSRDATHTETRTIPRLPFTTVANMGTWLAAQDENTAVTAYAVKLNVSDFGGGASVSGSVGATLLDNPTKFVSIDLSGSTFTAIPDQAFNAGMFSSTACAALTEIIIPDSVISIGNLAFNGCTNLTCVTLGSGVSSIGYSAFISCFDLASITVSPANTVYKVQNNCLLYNATTVVLVPSRVEGAITIPDGVTSIEMSAFLSCTRLTGVTIPDTVTSIGAQAFSGCYRLTSIDIPANVIAIGANAFNSCTGLTSITFKGMIAETDLGSELGGRFLSPFKGDLSEKYLAGGIGTYTTTTPVPEPANTWNPVWTKN